MENYFLSTGFLIRWVPWPAPLSLTKNEETKCIFLWFHSGLTRLPFLVFSLEEWECEYPNGFCGCWVCVCVCNWWLLGSPLLSSSPFPLPFYFATGLLSLLLTLRVEFHFVLFPNKNLDDNRRKTDGQNIFCKANNECGNT